MDQTVCARCGKSQAEHFVSFAVISSHSDKKYSTEMQGINKVETTTTTTTETFQGVESFRVCEECIQKQRKASARVWFFFTFLVVLIGGFVINFILSIFIFAPKQSYHTNYGLYALISLGIALIAGVLLGLLFRSARLDTEPPFVAAELYKELKGKSDTYQYVPLVPQLYCRGGESVPDAEVFKSKNNLKTNLSDTLFIRYIRSGQ